MTTEFDFIHNKNVLNKFVKSYMDLALKKDPNRLQEIIVLYNNIKEQIKNDKYVHFKSLFASMILLEEVIDVRDLLNLWRRNIKDTRGLQDLRYGTGLDYKPVKNKLQIILNETKRNLINGTIKYNFTSLLNVKDNYIPVSSDRGKLVIGNKKKKNIGFLNIVIPESNKNKFYNEYGEKLLGAQTYQMFNQNVSRKKSLLQYFSESNLKKIYSLYPKIPLNNKNGRTNVEMFGNLNSLVKKRSISVTNAKTFEITQKKSMILNNFNENYTHYLYLLDIKDNLYLIPLENQFEVYGKHIHIVLKKNIDYISAAGEMSIIDNVIRFNLYSGTFMLNFLFNSNKKYRQETWRKNKMKKYLRKRFEKTTVKFVKSTLLQNKNFMSKNAIDYLNSKSNYVNYKIINNLLN